MDNHTVARILYEVAEFLALDGVPFKPQAYRRAAQIVDSLDEPIGDRVAAGTQRKLPGIGDAIAKKTAEIVETGHLEYHDTLKAKLLIELHALMQVDGVGPKTPKQLYEELGVRGLDDLERAARAGRVRAVKGLGAKTEEKILRGLDEAKRAKGRMLLGTAWVLATGLLDQLRATGRFDRVEYAGSLRRGRETIGDLDLLSTASDADAASAAFVSLPAVAEVLAHGEKKSAVRLSNGVQVDLRIVPAVSFGAAAQYFTGSQAHNIALRKRAVTRGWKLSEYGLFDADGTCLAAADEAAIYGVLGLQPIPPELRENQGEIDAAAKDALPVLVDRDDIRGDLHVHTDWSDGKASLETMVDTARVRGYEYVAITDHVKFSEVIRGLTVDDILRQIDAIAALRETTRGFSILSGTEVNVQSDRALDVPDAVLKRLDVVIASVHGSFRLPRAEMTQRLIRAVSSEHVDILGHPTTRKIGERPPIEADWDTVFEAAAKHGTALEVNANPIRLDLGAELIRRAVDAGAKLAVSTDAHAPEHLDFMRLGVITARRGWATKADVVNAVSFGSQGGRPGMWFESAVGARSEAS